MVTQRERERAKRSFLEQTKLDLSPFVEPEYARAVTALVSLLPSPVRRRTRDLLFALGVIAQDPGVDLRPVFTQALDFMRSAVFKHESRDHTVVTVLGAARMAEATHPEASRAVAELGKAVSDALDASIKTGAGPGVMRLVWELMEGLDHKKQGVRIDLGFEPPSEEALRLAHYVLMSEFEARTDALYAADVLLYADGGNGTFQELFDPLSSMTNGKLAFVPMVLFDPFKYWQTVHDWLRDRPVEDGYTSAPDMDNVVLTHSKDEVLEAVWDFYANISRLDQNLEKKAFEIDLRVAADSRDLDFLSSIASPGIANMQLLTYFDSALKVERCRLSFEVDSRSFSAVGQFIRRLKDMPSFDDFMQTPAAPSELSDRMQFIKEGRQAAFSTEISGDLAPSLA